MGGVAGKKSFGVIGIPCAVNGILHGTFHTGITLLILVTKNLGNVCGRSVNCYHNGIGQIFVTDNFGADPNELQFPVDSADKSLL